MDLDKMDHGLLKRNPAMTQKEFSDHWYYKHAPIVIPMFLYMGIQYYEQIHGPLSLKHLDSKVNEEEWSGAAGAVKLPPQEALDNPARLLDWVQAYYDEVVKVDERRFLVSEALDHIFRVGPRSVTGEKRVLIQEGKPLVHVPEEIWEVWRSYEKRGKAEEGR